MKSILFLFLCFLSLRSEAQCPFISGAMIDAASSGLPSGEGKNEFIVFNTGSSSINVNSIFLSYGTSTSTTAFSIDGAAVPNVWVSPVTSGLFSNTGGTITQVTSGSIPANRNVVVISKDNAVSYDFQTFGTDVYVLSYDQGLAGVSGYLAAGRFPNTGSAPRYFRISQGATCRDTVSYIPDSLPGADGGGVKWNAAGVATYANTGSSGAVLPIQLLDFGVGIKEHNVELKWTVAASSSVRFFEIEKSTNGIEFLALAKIEATESDESPANQYLYRDNVLLEGNYFYRLKIIDEDGSSTYSSTKMVFYATVAKPVYFYPNPVKSYVTFLNNAGYETASVMDALGNIVLNQVLVSGPNSIDFSHLYSGVYWLRLGSARAIENYKIAKE